MSELIHAPIGATEAIFFRGKTTLLSRLGVSGACFIIAQNQLDVSRETVRKITASGADAVFNTIVPPGLTPFFDELYNSGFQKHGGQLICTYFDENFLNLVPAEQVEGLYGCLDYYQEVNDPFSRELLNRYNKLFPGSAQFTAGSACTGLYRGMKLWEAAVKEAGTLEQTKVIAALDHAKIAQGPGGPAEMVPGQHHVRINMYIAQAKAGQFKVVKSLGLIEPKEQVVRGELPQFEIAGPIENGSISNGESLFTRHLLARSART